MTITKGQWLYGNWCVNCGEFYKSIHKYGTTCQNCLDKMTDETKERRKVIKDFLAKYKLPKGYPATYTEVINKNIKIRENYGELTKEKIRNINEKFRKEKENE